MCPKQSTVIPEVSRLRAFLDSRQMIKNPIGVFDKYTARLGNTFVYYFGGVKKVIVSSNPDLMEHVLKTNHENYHKSEIQMRRMRHFLGHGLLTTNGKAWVDQRRLLQQGFHREQLIDLGSTMHESLEESLKSFDEEILRGPIDIYSEMMKITFRMVSRSLFSTNLADTEVSYISHTISSVQRFMVRQIVQPYLGPWFTLSGELLKFEKMRDRGNKLVLNCIKQRRKDRGNHHDLLQILLDARYGETDVGMNDEQVLSETMQLLVAGHETSSNALSWVLYLLSQHPTYIEQIRDELDTKVGNNPIQYSDISKLEITVQIIEESLRLYPPFWMIDRVSLSDDQVSDIFIPKGTTVIAYIHGAHHSDQYWDEPESFIPQRFSKLNRKNHTNFSYLPFGGGPRGCIGGNYAMLQMLIILCVLLRKFDYELAMNQVIEPHPMIILKPRNGIRMNFSKVRI